MTQESYRMQNI